MEIIASVSSRFIGKVRKPIQGELFLTCPVYTEVYKVYTF